MDTQKHGNKEKLSIKKAFLYLLVNLQLKKLVNSKNLNKNVVFIKLILSLTTVLEPSGVQLKPSKLLPEASGLQPDVQDGCQKFQNCYNT